MSKKLLLIYNPTSGKAQVKSRLSDIIEVSPARRRCPQI